MGNGARNRLSKIVKFNEKNGIGLCLLHNKKLLLTLATGSHVAVNTIELLNVG